MQKTRVLIAGMPGMLADIVRATVDEAPDMTVVEGSPTDTSVGAAVERTGAEVVVVGAEQAEVAENAPRALVDRARSLSFLAVDSDGHESVLYTLRPVRRALGELSSRRLLAAIRRREAAPPPDPANDQAN